MGREGKGEGRTKFQLREGICHFLQKSVVSFTHEQNIFCSKTNLDAIAHVQTIICRELFAGHVLGSCPMKKEGKNASNDNYYLSMHFLDFLKVLSNNFGF